MLVKYEIERSVATFNMYFQRNAKENLKVSYCFRSTNIGDAINTNLIKL